VKDHVRRLDGIVEPIDDLLSEALEERIDIRAILGRRLEVVEAILALELVNLKTKTNMRRKLALRTHDE